MKIFYKNSYKLTDRMTSCIDCLFHISHMCPNSVDWFSCGKSRLILDNTQIFDL